MPPGASNASRQTIFRAVLTTIGRFHSFDLARQLHRRGALEAIFSGYPFFKLKNEKLPRNRIKTFPWLHAPFLRFPHHYSASLKRAWEWQDRIWLDRYVARHLPPCDLFCGLSAAGLFTAQIAKARGAKYVCDRGSSHIRYQDRLLREEYDRQGLRFPGIDPRIIVREEAEYELADAVTVPSTFAFNSFVELGVPANKLRLVPYGVDLSRFYLTEKPNDREFRVLFVGRLSVRKGLRYLIEAFDKLAHPHKRLFLIGSVEPALRETVAKLGSRPDVTLAGHLPQPELKHVMSSSHVMVLPSIEEGLALVQAQAMACGCPVVCSTNTGGENLFTDGVEGFVTPIRDSDAIANCLQILADHPARRERLSAAALKRAQDLGGWDEYGEAIYGVFSELVQR
jgi:glycosyltransferase involved in cell wall biosynthesis